MMSGQRRLDHTIPTATHPGKMRIKAFPTSMDDSYVKQIWDSLRKAIIEIQKKNNSGLSFEELYRNAYTMVLQKHGEQLYNGTRQVVTEHMLRIRENVVNNLNNNFLKVLNDCFKDHHTAMVMIRDILMYMDRVYVIQNDKQNVYNLGMIIFRINVLRHPAIKEQLQQILLNMIQRERRNEFVSKSQIREACQMLVQLGVNSLSVYEEDFERKFLDQSREYFSAECDSYREQQYTSIQFIKRVEEILLDESKRTYLDSSTHPKLIRVIEQELISKPMDMIINQENSGLVSLLENGFYGNISSMYRLLCRVEGGLDRMSKCISDYLRDQGRRIINEENKSPQQYIQDLMQLRDKATIFLTEALNNQNIFRIQINSDFEYFINLSNRSPEYLSLFIDDKLKRGTKGVADQDLDSIFDKCIVLFRYLQDKDIFERYYKHHLARRLLQDKSQSDDQEKSMISKLIVECGGVFTSKLEGMFRDIAVSKTLKEDYLLGSPPHSEMLNVRVLTTGLWPTEFSSHPVILPQEADIAFKAFSNFYLGKHNGRVINLQPSRGHADLDAYFPTNAHGPTTSTSSFAVPWTSSNGSADDTLDASKVGQTSIGDSRRLNGSSDQRGSHSHAQPTTSTLPYRKYILAVSTYQMIILVKFNQCPRYTFAELLSQTSIPEADLVRSLLSLTVSKASQRLLVKEPKTKSTEILHTDSFTVNDAFVSRHTKIRLQNIALKETEPEQQETRTKVDENRKYAVDATIVRIMKSRKQLQHNQLVTEVINQLKSRFSPIPTMIKTRIESLLDRDFLARSPDDHRLYIYQA